MTTSTAEGVALAADPALAGTADASALSPMEAALQRLTASRVRLRNALIPEPDSRGTAADGGGSVRRTLQATWRRWRRQWRDSPVIDVVMSSVQSWWKNNPWREMANTVADEAGALLAPAVRRRPWTAVLVAAGAGLAIATLRPWRWSLVAAQLRPLRHQAVNWVVGQALTAPLHTIFAGLMAGFAMQREPAGGPAAAAGAANTTAAAPTQTEGVQDDQR